MRRITPVASLIAAVLALSVGLVACGDDARQQQCQEVGRHGQAQGADRAAVDHAQRPQAQGGHRGRWSSRSSRRPASKVERRGRRLGRAVRPHPQRGDLGRGPGRHAGGHDAGAVLRRARRLRGHRRPRRGHRRQGRLPGRRLADHPGRRPDGTWALPWFTEARAIYYRKDVLKKAGVDEATAFADWDAFRATLEKIKTGARRSTASRSSRSARRARRRSTSSTT